MATEPKYADWADEPAAPRFDDIEGDVEQPKTAPSFDAIDGVETHRTGASPAPNPYEAAIDELDAKTGAAPLVPGTSEPGNPYEAWLDSEPGPEARVAEENRHLHELFRFVQYGPKQPAERRAEVLRFSKQSGIPTPVVEAGLDRFKAQWASARFDAATWRKENPAIAKMVLSSSPELAPIAMEDPKLSIVSKLLNKVSHAFFTPYVAEGIPNREAKLADLEATRESVQIRPTKPQAALNDEPAKLLRNGDLGLRAVIPYARYREARAGLEVSKKQYELMMFRMLGRDADAYEAEKQVIDLKREAVKRNFGEGEVLQVASDVAEASASTVDVLGQATLGAGVVGAGSGLVAYAITKSPAVARQAALKGLSVGAKAGGVAGTFRLEAGDAYGELLESKTDDGRPVSNEVATGTALLYGAIASGIEFAAWGPMLKSMGPLGQLIRTGEKKAALAALVKDQGFREIAKRVAKNWAGASAAEGAEEFLQSATQDALTYLARSYQQGSLQTGPVVDVEKAIQAGKKGFVGGAGLASIGAGVDVFTQRMLRDDAHIATEQVAALAQLAGSPTVAASPAAAAQVVQETTAAAGNPVSAVHVTASEFERLVREAGADPAQAADAMLGPGGAQALADAVQTGSKLEVPLATYLEKWVGTQLAAQLLEHTTTAAVLPTAAEAKETTTDAAPANPDASWYLAERLANTEAPVDRGAEMYLDPISGLRNRRAFDETPAPEGKQLAVITSADVKAINDHPTAGGHDVANGMLRAMGRAIGEHDATAARSGTNFLVYVSDQAELDELLAKVRTAIGPNLNLEGALGADKTAAFDALKTGIETGRALGTIAPKGQASPGVDVAALKFGEERAQATVPPELAAKVAGLTPEEYFAQAYATKGGLLSAEGFRAVPRKAHTVAFDMSGLGQANTEFGPAVGDQLLATFEAALRAAGGADFDTAHLSGDEFAAQHDDPEALAAFVRGVQEQLAGVGVRARHRASGKVQDLPVRFRHGIGADYAQADRALNAARRAEEAGGGAAVRAAGADQERQAGVGREGGARPQPRRDRRQAYPRQVASDVEVEVERSAEAMGLRPIFRSAAEARMTPEQWREYLAGLEELHSHAAHAAELQRARDQERQLSAWWKEREAAERQSAEAEYEQLRPRQAQEFLRGRRPGAAFPVPLDRAAVVAAVGEEAARRFQTRAAEAAHPDDIADLFGYATGAEMLQEIAALPDKATWAKATALERMAEKHPDVLNDRLRLREVISKGLHGDFTEKWLTQEWKALNARAHQMVFNPEANRMQALPNELVGLPSAPAEETKKAAAAIVSRHRIGRLSPGWALNLERSHADKAAQASMRGNYALALTHKLQQLLAMHMWRELSAATDQRQAFYELAAELRRPGARARLGKASQVLLAGVDQVLEAVGLKAPEGGERATGSVADVVRELELDGATVMFDEDLLAKLVANPKAYRELTVAEMREVDTFLRNVLGAARSRTTALLEGRRIDREQAVAHLVTEAEANRRHVGPVSSSESAETVPQAVGTGWTKFDGSGLRPETLARWLGGNKPGSMWMKLVIEPLQKAKHTKADLLKKTVAPLAEKLEAALKDGRFMAKVDGKALFPTHREDVDAPTRVYELFMMALHAGTDSSLQRLTEGRGINEQQLRAAIDKHLWKEAVDLIQAVWDANESLWPAASELERRQSGVAPPKLERRPLETRFGTLAGGYMPAKYDARVEQVGERQLGEALGAVVDQSYVRPGTAKSHLKKRAENFSGALSLEPGLIVRALDQVVHDIAYREALRSVAGLIWDPKLQRVMRERLGTGRAEQFRQWLRDVGTDAGANLTDWWSRMGSALKKRTVVAALGYRLPTALGDLSNFLIGARHLGPGALLGGIAEVFTSQGKAIDQAYEKSGELRSRHGQMLERFKSDLSLMTKRGGQLRRVAEWFNRHAFTIFEWTEKLFAVPTWLGAYRKAQRAGSNEADSVAAADAMVRRLLPAWNPVDQSAIQRNRYLSPFMMFASWHNVIWNEVRSEVEPVLQAMGIKDKAKAAAVAVPAVLWIIFSSYVVNELLTGRGPEPDDGDDEIDRWLHWFGRKMLVGSVMPLPVIGPELGSVAESKVMHKRANARGSIYLSVVDPIVNAGVKMFDGDKDAEEKFFAAMRAIAPFVLGGQGTYPLTPAKYLLDTAQGETHPRGPGDVIGGTIYGAREGQPANVPTLLQDLAK